MKYDKKATKEKILSILADGEEQSIKEVTEGIFGSDYEGRHIAHITAMYHELVREGKIEQSKSKCPLILKIKKTEERGIVKNGKTFTLRIGEDTDSAYLFGDLLYNDKLVTRFVADRISASKDALYFEREGRLFGKVSLDDIQIIDGYSGKRIEVVKEDKSLAFLDVKTGAIIKPGVGFLLHEEDKKTLVIPSYCENIVLQESSRLAQVEEKKGAKA